jgi:hypothetical protein
LIDGRYEEVYTSGAYAKAMQLSQHGEKWRDVLKDFKPDILILPKKTYSLSDISSLTEWIMVYEDRTSTVLLSRDKIKPFYIYPDYKDPFYWKENFSKEVKPN